MLSPEFHEFHRNWLDKANRLQGNDIHTVFDRFFTLFVIYNRLYAEATFELAREGGVKLKPNSNFPDGNAAKTYVLKYLGAKNYLEELGRSQECVEAITTIIQLIDRRVFAIKLDMIYGQPQPAEDMQLALKLNSRAANEKGTAVLDVLYSVRCNMFHGHKGFEPIQLQLLQPATVLLEKTIDILFGALSRQRD